jgi:hypothetical protein
MQIVEFVIIIPFDYAGEKLAGTRETLTLSRWRPTLNSTRSQCPDLTMLIYRGQPKMMPTSLKACYVIQKEMGMVWTAMDIQVAMM